jgi:hypothetical protein
MSLWKQQCVYKAYPELTSMEAIMRHQDASKYLKLFLASHLQMENFLFWSECEKYVAFFKQWAERIVSTYIEENATSQVNIDAKMRSAVCEKVKAGDIDVNTFEKAQLEVYKVLNQNNYTVFLTSDFCKQYLKQKEKDAETRIRMSLADENMLDSSVLR